MQICTGMDDPSPAGHAQLDVIQKVMGHVSLQTTSRYLQAERQRILREVGRYHARVAGQDNDRAMPATEAPTEQRDSYA